MCRVLAQVSLHPQSLFLNHSTLLYVLGPGQYCSPRSQVKRECDLVWFWTWRNPSKTILFWICKGSGGCSYFPSCNSSLDFLVFSELHKTSLCQLALNSCPLCWNSLWHTRGKGLACSASPTCQASWPRVHLCFYWCETLWAYRNPGLWFRANNLVKAKKF